MLKKIKPMALSKPEDDLIRRLYVQGRRPRSHYKKNLELLEQFTALWNKLSQRLDKPHEVLQYFESQQKHKDRLEVPWPTFDGAHKRLEKTAGKIAPEIAKVIRSLYMLHVLPLDIGTDSLSYREDLMSLLSRELHKRTKVRIPGMQIAAWIENERKQQRWFTLRNDAGGLSGLDAIGE